MFSNFDYFIDFIVWPFTFIWILVFIILLSFIVSFICKNKKVQRNLTVIWLLFTVFLSWFLFYRTSTNSLENSFNIFYEKNQTYYDNLCSLDWFKSFLDISDLDPLYVKVKSDSTKCSLINLWVENSTPTTVHKVQLDKLQKYRENLKDFTN